MAVSDGAAYEVREHYTKYEYRVPMRDGVKLYTVILMRKGAQPDHVLVPLTLTNYEARIIVLEKF